MENKVAYIVYSNKRDSLGNLTYTKKDKNHNDIFENLDDIFNDIDFEKLVNGLN